MIQQLLREAAGEDIDNELVSVAPDGFEAQADWTNLRSPETYLGYAQGQNLDSPGGVTYDEPRSYVAPKSLQLNTWALGGNWTIEERASVLNEAAGRIAFRFHARHVHLVLRSRTGTAVPFRVLVDGEAPGAAHGLDVDEEGRGTLVQPRLYQPVREPGSITDRTLRSHFSRPVSKRTSSPSASDRLRLRLWCTIFTACLWVAVVATPGAFRSQGSIGSSARPRALSSHVRWGTLLRAPDNSVSGPDSRST